MPLDCERIGEHHSTDTVDLFHGQIEPLHLCGYHADRITADAALFNLLSV